MKRTILAFALLGGVAACGDGNPFTSDSDDGFDEAVEGADPAPSTQSAEEFDGLLSLNGVTYNDGGTPADPTDDTLFLNNVPFDSSDATGGAYTRTGTLPNGFERFESPVAAPPDSRQFFAVFRRTSVSQVTAVGSDEFIGPGFGGALAQRIGPGAVPAERPAAYIFTGDYAGIRETSTDGGAEGLQLVTGDVVMSVDVLDFDVSGAVDGTITNRQLFDQDGNSLGTLDDFVSLSTAEIDFTNATIEASNLSVQSTVTGDSAGSGDWSGVFAGPNGEEIAGIVVIDGTLDTDPTNGAGTVRETGTLIVVNNG
ncbi:hypothetical protein [uncultured Tateyamaria sp.]|uniref:hypothetical protein n=1 Tax=uncultured Tateyamaria sp. TaxID=455651 RepID=UPI0026025C8A|nr:hypothetical protein [uncultured Tateyamaria sp.]